ncbi:MAG TPA: hypothetical protein VMF30_15420 [Pirellulales bacterium]|nr:hypothetical protein [Pirellulales bacterium]
MRSKATKRQQFLRIIDDFVKEHNIAEGEDIDPDDLTAWAINSKRIEREKANFFRQTRRDLVKALKDEEVTDDQGRTIPRRAAIRIKGDKHQSRWFDFLKAKPRKALTALAQQRRSLVAYARKIKMKRESYNDNNRYGAELPLFDFNLNKDLRDAEQPTVWPDDAPDTQRDGD